MNTYTEDRPWGGFKQFTLNEKSTVKILTIKSGQAFSLQYHKNRKEFWHVLEGSCIVTVGNKDIKAIKGDEFTIEEGTHHRIEATEDTSVLEVAFGDFNESDIVRLEDKYGRK